MADLTRRSSPRSLGLVVFGGLLSVGCSGDTGSERFTFEASAAGVVGAPVPFTFANAAGWNVTLTQAEVTVGPIYLNVVPPLA